MSLLLQLAALGLGVAAFSTLGLFAGLLAGGAALFLVGYRLDRQGR